MAVHTMTAARRAALRKAQLASARKRRRYGPVAAARKATGQRAGYAANSAKLKARSAYKSPKNRKRAKGFVKKVGKGAAIGVGVGTASALAVAAGTHSGTKIKHKVKVGRSNRKANAHLKKIHYGHT